MRTIHFNTGRAYTGAGQQITATLHDDGVVTFMDHSRGIDGEFIPTDDLNQTEVMVAYDRCLYESTSRSRADGMQSGGCNAEYRGH